MHCSKTLALSLTLISFFMQALQPCFAGEKEELQLFSETVIQRVDRFGDFSNEFRRQESAQMGLRFVGIIEEIKVLREQLLDAQRGSDPYRSYVMSREEIKTSIQTLSKEALEIVATQGVVRSHSESFGCGTSGRI